VKFTILGKDFSSFGGELSMLMKYSAMMHDIVTCFAGETMKPKRHIIKETYKDVINAMYSEGTFLQS
jgi:esterase/lipase